MNKLRLTGSLLTRLLGLLLMYVSCMQVGYAQQSGGGNYPTGNGVRVREVDGSPNVPGTQTLVFPNGSLTRAGQTVTFSGGGGTTINSTNGQVPYRVNSTTFGDSAIASNALNSTYLSVTSGASGAGVPLTVAGGGTNENLILTPKGTGVIEQRNGTNAQTFRVYSTYTDASNYERLSTAFSGGNWTITPQQAGTGGFSTLTLDSNNSNGILLNKSTNVAGSLYVGSSGFSVTNAVRLNAAAAGVLLLTNGAATDFSRLQFGGTSSSFPSIKRNGAGLDVRLADDSGYAPIAAGAGSWNGHQTFATDNTYDIGASGATRPRNIFAAGYVSASTKVWAFEQHIGGSFAVPRALIKADADNTMTLYDQTQTGFGRLQFGGNTSSFPSLKRSSTELQVVLADDTGFAATQSLYIRYGSGTPEGAVTAPVGAIYSRTDGGAGTSFYVKESGSGNTGWVAK